MNDTSSQANTASKWSSPFPFFLLHSHDLLKALQGFCWIHGFDRPWSNRLRSVSHTYGSHGQDLFQTTNNSHLSSCNIGFRCPHLPPPRRLPNTQNHNLYTNIAHLIFNIWLMKTILQHNTGIPAEPGAQHTHVLVIRHLACCSKTYQSKFILRIVTIQLCAEQDAQAVAAFCLRNPSFGNSSCTWTPQLD